LRLRAILLSTLLAGCGSQSALDYGRGLYSSAALSPAADNAFSCATCHEVAATPTSVRPGYTMHDVVHRAGWWGGAELTLFDAVNECVEQFMFDQPNGLSPSDDNARALLVYLESLSPDASAPQLPLTVVQNIVNVPSGNATNGAQLWKQACGSCHGAPNTGQGRLTPLASLVPKETIAVHPSNARLVVIEKVRHGKFFNVGGRMPLFSLEALSDAQLGDLLAYLETFGLPAQ
jgi:thiosulfate dehydrogenase